MLTLFHENVKISEYLLKDFYFELPYQGQIPESF